jgi:hypothetical protein
LKLVQKRAENILEAISLVKDFLSGTQVVQQLREMINKWHYILHNKRNGYLVEEAMCRMGEKLCQLYIRQGTDRIYRELKKLNSQKINDLMMKWANELNRAFSKEEVQMAKKHMKNYLPSLAIKETKVKSILIFHLTPVKIATIENITSNKS